MGMGKCENGETREVSAFFFKFLARERFKYVLKLSPPQRLT
jgi:hypothetical protein